MRKQLSQALNDLEKRKRLGRNLMIVGTVMVAGSLYAKHRQVVNAAISAQQDLAFETMWASFDQGVKYGLELAKERAQAINTESAKELSKATSEYAFGMFDRPA